MLAVNCAREDGWLVAMLDRRTPGPGEGIQGTRGPEQPEGQIISREARSGDDVSDPESPHRTLRLRLLC